MAEAEQQAIIDKLNEQQRAKDAQRKSDLVKRNEQAQRTNQESSYRIDPREMAGTLPTGSKTKKWKGKYVGPDKYKGVIPEHLKSKYKGKYFGPDSAQGSNKNASDLKAIGKKIKRDRGTKPGVVGTPLPPNTPGWTDENGVRHAGNEPGKKYLL